jgi:hypothetical protein
MGGIHAPTVTFTDGYEDDGQYNGQGSEGDKATYQELLGAPSRGCCTL